MKRILVLALGVAILGGAPSGALAADKITVETRNLYLGADLTPILTALTPAAFNAALVTALAEITATNFPERAQALAKEIADKQPHLVGLQEVFNFTKNFGNGAVPFRDYLADLMSALAAEGASYVVAASVQNLNIVLPVDEDFDGLFDFLLGATDRDVILARADIAAAVTPVPFPLLCAARASLDGCNYSTVVMAPTALGPITIERGFVGVDATIGGKTYRFLNTHLEVMFPAADPFAPAIQAAQATELNALLAASLGFFPLPAGSTPIVVGDINSSPDDGPFPDPILGPFVPPYTQFASGVNLFGFGLFAAQTDAWDLRPGNDPGFTCCELSDLSNKKTLDDERIDVIFSVQVPSKVKANVIGNEPSDKTKPSRLWPSDHAGVVGTLTFP